MDISHAKNQRHQVYKIWARILMALAFICFLIFTASILYSAVIGRICLSADEPLAQIMMGAFFLGILSLILALLVGAASKPKDQENEGTPPKTPS